ncbi:MAG: exopolysaccharide Pel transporter PelG [Polyangiaceae bacterium]|nr:exopolysaccharide Pel transporter PelG [Polyangiaceae bacterium]
MAGIGFELRQHLQKETYAGLITAYSIAAIIGSGPWVISIVGTILTGLVALAVQVSGAHVAVFFATITHVTAASLITSGMLQLLFTRFVADRLFEKKRELVVPNLFGALLLTTLVSGLLATLFVLFAFRGLYGYRLLFIVNFVTLNDVWILSVFLTGMKAYRMVVLLFLSGYSACLLLALALARFGAEGLLLAFFVGQALLLLSMLVLVVRQYPSDIRVAFDFLNRRLVFPVLAGTGALYNLGIWIDKFIFWWTPQTSSQVLGPIRLSIIYDVPIFLAYFSIVPGMAVFLVRIETDFADAYDAFFRAVREGASLSMIERLRNQLVSAARDGLYDIFRVQGLTVLFVILIGPRVLAAIGIPLLYVPLFNIDVMGTGIQVVFLGVLTVLFYLDYRALSFGLNVLFCIANLSLTMLTIHLGSRFYGYGFACSLLVATAVGLAILTRKLDRIEYETFMR